MSYTRKPTMSPDPANPEERDLKQKVPQWSREEGERIAAEERVEMSQVHWAVIDFLRDYYRHHGAASSGREVAQALDRAFADHGGKSYLHELFPAGPVAQGSRIGGVPMPPRTEDESLGSAM